MYEVAGISGDFRLQRKTVFWVVLSNFKRFFKSLANRAEAWDDFKFSTLKLAFVSLLQLTQDFLLLGPFLQILSILQSILTCKLSYLPL